MPHNACKLARFGKHPKFGMMMTMTDHGGVSAALVHLVVVDCPSRTTALNANVGDKIHTFWHIFGKAFQLVYIQRERLCWNMSCCWHSCHAYCSRALSMMHIVVDGLDSLDASLDTEDPALDARVGNKTDLV